MKPQVFLPMPEKFTLRTEATFLVRSFSNSAQRNVSLSSHWGHWCQLWSPATALQLPRKDPSAYSSLLRAEDLPPINFPQTSFMLN